MHHAHATAGRNISDVAGDKYLATKERYLVRELEHQIDTSTFELAMTGNKKLASVMREIYPTANEHFKETYVLDFLNLPISHSKRKLRKSIVQNLKQFII